MKTLEEVLKNWESNTLDGRDGARLTDFVADEDLEKIGFEPREGVTRQITPWTRENILAQLERDVAFGFEKALGQRGISSSLMFEVVRMWNEILEEGLEDWESDHYAMYGLPLFKATAVKYGFDNPIGDDEGSEEKYNE